MRNVFITGISGFVGSHLAKQLIEDGMQVTGLVHDIKRETYPLVKANLVRGDICDLKELERIIAQYEIDAIFHLAARSIVSSAQYAPLPVYKTNVMGTVKLLEACRITQLPRSIVVMSTDKVYGEGMNAKETDALNGLGIYESSKVAADQIARAYAHIYDMPVTVARCCNIYGFDLNKRLVPNTIKRILEKKEPIVFKEEILSKREYIFIEDAIDALIFLAKNINQTKGKAWNIGTGDVISQEDMVMEILFISNTDLEPNIKEREKVKEISKQSLDISAIHNLGWTPKFTLREGLKRTYKEFEVYYEKRK